jgi:translation initiation factor 2 subunit 1
VTGREKAEKMLQWKKEKKAESIVKSASEKTKIEQTSIDMIKQKVFEKYDSLYDAFEDVLEGGEEVFTKLGIPSDLATALSEAARSKIRLEKAKVKATVELTCFKPSGIEAIRTALLNAKKIRKPRGTDIRIYTVGSPRYRVEITAKDYSDGERTLNEVIGEALATIKNLGGEGRRIG